MAGNPQTVTTDAVADLPAATARATQALSLRHNFAWTFAGNAAYAGGQWVLLMILAKLGSPELVGRFALAVAISLPINAFCTIALRSFQVTDAKDEYLFGHYIGLRILGMGLAIAVTAAVGFAAYPPNVAILIPLVALNHAVNAIRDIFLGAMQKFERMDYAGIGRMIAAVPSVACFGLAIYVSGNLGIAVATMIAAQLLVLLFYDRTRVQMLMETTAPDGGPNPVLPVWDASALWRLAKQAMPLGIVMMILSAQSTIPRYFVEAWKGEAMLGYFAPLVALLQAGTMVTGALGQSASPRLARYFQDNIRAYVRLMGKLLLAGAVVGSFGVVLAVLFGRPILRILFAPDYAQHAPILVQVMIAGGISFVGSFLGFGMTAARYLNVQVPLNIVVMAVILAGSWVLIGPYGLSGAAMTLIAGAVLRCLLQAVVVVYAVRVRSAALSSC